MFFTEEDYRKIEKWLVSKGVMDTQFSPAAPLDGNETVAIVQNGKNVNATIDALVEKLFLLGVADFLNVTDKYEQPAIPLIQAISLIPFRHRKIGQVITFLNKDNKWVMYQFQGSSLTQWNNPTQWVDVIGSAITGELVPDEEDLTGIKEGDNTVLKFKNKAYSTANFSGLGRVYLRKNIAGGRNILTQQMINQENTRYILQYDYDLNGQTITIPNNCVIEFEGGSISNGTITGQNTEIKSSLQKLFSTDINLNGSWVTDYVYPEWFGLIYNSQSFGDNNRKAIQSALNAASNFNNIVKIGSGVVWIAAVDGSETAWNDKSILTISVPSNTSLILNNDSELKVIPNNYTHYTIIGFQECENSSIIGGTITGDVTDHVYTEESTSEWCHGIRTRGAHNIIIKDLTVQEFPGDGLSLGALYTTVPVTDALHSTNIKIDNVESINNRRQACSITGANGVIIENCNLSDTGKMGATLPTAGIDIESDGIEGVVLKNIRVTNCKIVDNGLTNSGASIRNVAMWNPTAVTADKVDNITFSNCDFRNTDIEKEGFVESNFKVNYTNCRFDVVNLSSNYPESQLATLNNCTLRSLVVNGKTNAVLNYTTILSTSLEYRQIQTYTVGDVPTGNIILNNCIIELISSAIIGNGNNTESTKNIRFNTCIFRNVGTVERQGVRLYSATYYECIYENCIMGLYGEVGSPNIIAGYNLYDKYNGNVVTNAGLYKFENSKPYFSDGTSFKEVASYIPTVSPTTNGLLAMDKILQLPTANTYTTKEWSYNVGGTSKSFIVWVFTAERFCGLFVRSRVSNNVVTDVNVTSLLVSSNLGVSIKVNKDTGILAFKYNQDVYVSTFEQSVMPTVTPISRLAYPTDLTGFSDITLLTGLWDGEKYINYDGTLANKVVII